VRAFAQGRPYECFGRGFELARAHKDSPRIPERHMQLFDEVVDFDPRGGPWKRGYLRAELTLAPTTWFFHSHFLNDPCMPGTLMFEGALQCMAFYLAAVGYTLDKDGWHFSPVPDEPFELICRGQVTPKTQSVVYEIFVEELHVAPLPTLYAAVLCTVDGLKAFHVRRMGYRLTPS
jgi:3-hydroxymyristoyl/3-hydroxydecanoyl-(acyl carrier protein) dehydratase